MDATYFIATAYYSNSIWVSCVLWNGAWEYSVAPIYLRARNIEGSASLGGVSAPLDLDFMDVLIGRF